MFIYQIVISLIFLPSLLLAEVKAELSYELTPLLSTAESATVDWRPFVNETGSTSDPFHPILAGTIDFPYSNKVRWIKLDLASLPELPVKFYVYFDSGMSGEMSLYAPGENQKYERIQVTGSTLPWEKRFIQNEFPVFELTPAQAQQGPLFISYQGVHHFNAHAYLSTPQDFLKKQYGHHIILAIYFGIVFALFFYNLFLAFASGLRIYYWYVFTIATYAAATLSLCGLLDRIFPLENTSVSTYQFMLSALALCSTLQLGRKIMRLDQLKGHADFVLKLEMIISFVLLILYPILVIFVGAYLGFVIDGLIVISILSIIWITARQVYSGNVFAKFYLISWSFIFIGAFGYLGSQFNLLPKNLLTQYGFYIGNTLEMILLSFALAYRIHLLTIERNDAEKRAQERDQYQRLVRTLAHDVANSLSIIHTLANKIQMAPTVAEGSFVAGAVQKILRASKNLHQLLNRVRSSESMQDNLEEWTLEEVSLKEMILESEFIFSDQIESKKIRLHHEEIPEDLKVMAEPVTLLNEVLNNAISNAIKFSIPGSMIDLKFQTDKPGFIILEIIDKGIGIPKAMLDHFFMTTEMKSRTGTNGEKGTGYGMPLMVQYMRAYGGTARIRSEEGKGTRVILQFKRA